MTKIVLVTGSGGFVGSHVVEVLLARTDWHVIGVDSFQHNGELERLVAATGESIDRVTSLTHDITVPFSSRQLHTLEGIDYVVNVASRCHVGESIVDPVEFVTNNVRLMLTVLELARLVEPQRLIHMSTDEVYGPHASRAETDHRPSSPYAASKAAQEDICHAYARTYDVATTIVNSANMFGERQGTLAFIPRLIRALVRGDEHVTIHYTSGKPGERSYTYVRNVATAIIDELITNDASSRDVRRLALTGQRRIDNLTLAHRVADLVGVPLSYHVVDGDDARPGYDPTYESLGGNWLPHVSFEDGLRATVDWGVNYFKRD